MKCLSRKYQRHDIDMLMKEILSSIFEKAMSYININISRIHLCGIYIPEDDIKNLALCTC